jgi:SH3-like domain-containing protein
MMKVKIAQSAQKAKKISGKNGKLKEEWCKLAMGGVEGWMRYALWASERTFE